MAYDINLTDNSQYNLLFYRGRTLNKSIIADVYSGSTLVDTFDFTPYTGATLTVKIKSTDNYSVMEFSTEDGSIVLGSGGEFQLIKSASEMNILAGVYQYDMYLTNSLVKRAFISGQISVQEKVGL